MTNFAEFGLEPSLLESLKKMNYDIPTPIQAEAIPVALQGKDILGSASTGTGKTAAFSIPLLNHLMTTPKGLALILTPTRELATQIFNVMRQMVPNPQQIRGVLLIGGEPMGPQFQDLRRSPRIIIGTPGRVKDHLERGSLKLNDCNFLVLDETDRMLHMGFEEQLNSIVDALPSVHQTLLFSATLPQQIVKLSQKYLIDPVRIAIGSTTAVAAKIKQEVVHTTAGHKYQDLLKQLESREGSIIVFVKTKRGADRLSEKLTEESHSASAIHGDLPQMKRDRVIRGFRDRKNRILVATDVAARGLDIPHIEHVINYDLPQCPEDYIHRIGRTGRAGAEGSALCLLEPSDQRKWRAIELMLNPNAKPSHAKAETGPWQRRSRPSANPNARDGFMPHAKKSFRSQKNVSRPHQNHAR
ncbi:MAG: DEAD/DEAH box helicase [Janthinobacterium lividum]